MLLSGAATYILGMGVSAIASYIILATLVAPAMVQGGIPLLVAHMFLLYMGASMCSFQDVLLAAVTALCGVTVLAASPRWKGFCGNRS